MVAVESVDPKKRLRAYVSRFPTKRAAAKALRISPAYLTDLWYGRRRLTPGLLKKLGLHTVVAEIPS